jgi:hypothetical protein
MGIPCLRFVQLIVNKQKISEIAVQRQEASEKNQMAMLLTYLIRRVSCSLSVALVIVLAISAASILSAQAQDFGERSHKAPQFPVENHPRVSEKDYKAALEKIPTPTQKYDPWGGAHTNEAEKGGADTAKNTKKTNPVH